MAITFIAGSAQFLQTSASTIATPSTLNVSTGDTIVVSVRPDANSTTYVVSMTDTAGNTYRQAGRQIQAGQSTNFEVWYCTNCASNASNTVTATLSAASGARGIAAAQFRGVATISPLDVLVS